jgi:phosphonate transport system substrate-binding protein
MKGKFLSSDPCSLTGLLFFLLLVTGCKSKANSYEPTYSVDTSQKKTLLYGVPTQAYYETHTAFVNYLNEHLQDIHLQIVASSDFSIYVDKVNKGVFELAIANGIMALDSNHIGYSVACESVGEEPNAGVILVHKDSSINNFLDLKGKTIATPGSPALPGHMFQMLYLFKKGLNVNRDIKLKYLESFESVILNIYLGKCSAGFTAINGWRSFLKKRPEIASKVELKWVTSAAPGNTVLIRNTVNEKTASHIKNLILTMNNNEEGRKALSDLGYTKFVAADNNTYLPLRNFLKEYKELIVDPRY